MYYDLLACGLHYLPRFHPFLGLISLLASFVSLLQIPKMRFALAFLLFDIAPCFSVCSDFRQEENDGWDLVVKGIPSNGMVEEGSARESEEVDEDVVRGTGRYLMEGNPWDEGMRGDAERESVWR